MEDANGSSARAVEVGLGDAGEPIARQVRVLKASGYAGSRTN